MTPQSTDTAGQALGEIDPHHPVLGMLLVFARVYSRGGFVIAEHIEPRDKALAEAILEDLADLADNLPSCRNGRTH